ncbi:MAG TPA: signal peptidase II [Lachnospiraceae bacterium]|nr:signal peptidase II [Lachnospiraceae bacterium]
MRLGWLQLALGLFQADLAVKEEIERNPEFDREHVLWDGKVRVRKLHNDGMAGGRLKGHMPALIKISGCMTLGCVGMFLRLLGKEGHTTRKLGYAFLTGGALSNLYDRCRRGYVVDYISFGTPLKKLNNLVFNLSDFFILTGALLICLGRTDQAKD